MKHCDDVRIQVLALVKRPTWTGVPDNRWNNCLDEFHLPTELQIYCCGGSVQPGLTTVAQMYSAGNWDKDLFHCMVCFLLNSFSLCLFFFKCMKVKTKNMNQFNILNVVLRKSHSVQGHYYTIKDHTTILLMFGSQSERAMPANL